MTIDQHVNISNTVFIPNKWGHLNIKEQGSLNFKSFKKGRKKNKTLIDDYLIIQVHNNIYTYPPKSGAIIFNSDKTKILCVLNAYNPRNGKWGLPKGHMEFNETRNDCASRELLEETGIHLNIKANDPYIKINNSMYYVFYMDENKIKNCEQKDKKEIKEVKFHTIDFVKGLNINKELRIIVTKKLNIAKTSAKLI